MSGKRFKKSPLWGLSYDNPGLDQKLTRIHKALKEVDGLLVGKKGKEGKKKGKV